MIALIELDESSSFDALAHDIKHKTGVRVTIVAQDGVVLAESDMSKESMQNHAGRAEIVEARSGAVGSSVRFSDSVKSDFLYVAKLIDVADKRLFVRLAYPLESINERFYAFWIKTTLFFFLSMLLAFFIAIGISKNSAQDLAVVRRRLRDLLNKKYKHSKQTVVIREFSEILDQIELISKKLSKQEVQKNRYTKNLKIINKKQSDIISAISHEFKNPIAAIIGYSQTLADDSDLDIRTRTLFLEKIDRNAYKISHMIDRLSMAIKLDDEEFKPTLSKFNLLPLLEYVQDTLLQKYTDREIVIDVPSVTVNADKVMIENLFINLVDNALKYSQDRVIIRSDESRFYVEDSGVGIESRDIKNITKRFFRVEDLSWDNSIGVGLYIVKYILKLHNTTLQIDSSYGRGSVFSFELERVG